MDSGIVKRSVLIKGRKTSVSLEDAFWNALRGIAAERQVSTPTLLADIEMNRGNANLSSAVRQFVINYLLAINEEYRKIIAKQGHAGVQHPANTNHTQNGPAPAVDVQRVRAAS
ncbi:MAG: ribbon-helix-helix domain-containing protein [Proteobacteria bacterium]|nr:ribbon-helix-helix domain-containing protein [Pseudomonadota bacterium]